MNSFTKIARRGLLALLAMAACAVQAAGYPEKPIKLVVPMAPGGSVDAVARAVGRTLAKNVGQPVVVENRPGAGGTIGAGLVARAAPDGYTVLIVDTGITSINPFLYKSLSYDKSKPFVAVTEAVAAPLYLAVNAALPVKSVGELIALAKKSDGALSFSSVGTGSVHHLGMEHLAATAGVKLIHVPYKGAAPASAAIAAGDIQVGLAALTSLRPFVAAGKIRLLAVATPKRVAATPNIPTIAESGLPGFSVSVTVGFLLPPDTPASVESTLRSQILTSLSSPEVKMLLVDLGLVPIENTGAEYRDNIASEAAKYEALVRKLGITVD